MRIVRIPPDGPPTEPVTLGEAKAALRVTHDLEDGFISGLIVAAREYAELRTRYSLVPSTWEIHLDAFPRGMQEMELPHPPLLRVEEVRYRNTNDAWVVVDPDDYETDLSSEPGAIILHMSAAWPTARAGRSNLRVRYRAGYGDAETPLEVPASIRTGILMLVGHWYLNREAVVVGAVSGELELATERLFWHHRFDL